MHTDALKPAKAKVCAPQHVALPHRRLSAVVLPRCSTITPSQSAVLTSAFSLPVAHPCCAHCLHRPGAVRAAGRAGALPSAATMMTTCFIATGACTFMVKFAPFCILVSSLSIACFSRVTADRHHCL